MKKENLTKVQNDSNGHILAEGEATGHKHRVTDGTIELYQNEKGDKFISALSDFTITHEEHAPMTVEIKPEEKSNFTVGIVREYDHLKEEARKVMD